MDSSNATLILEKITALQNAETREVGTTNLENTIQEIEELYASVSPKSKASVANSLGLAYRRLGERGDIDLLKKAITVFEDGINTTTQNPPTNALSVELQNNMAITYIRMFELEKDEDYLDKAEVRLSECVPFMEESPGSNDSVLKANVYNNAGNLWKQRYIASQKSLHAEKALQNYEQAENLSPEKDYPYFWATIQKNKGEVKYLLSKTDKDPARILEGVLHCLDSMQYRDWMSAPYQWLKSVEVLFDLVLLTPESFIQESEYKEKVATIVAEFASIKPTLDPKSYMALKEKYQQVKNILGNL